MLHQFFNTVLYWYLNSLNYGTITLLMVIESSFIPFPSELVLPPAAYQCVHGDLNVWLVILFATIGCIIGALFNYYLAITLGRKIIYSFANTKIARFFFIKPASIEKSEQYFNRHGRSATFVGRLVPAVRQLISIPAGLSKMNIGVFILFTFLGSAIWNAILTLLSYGISYRFKEITMEVALQKIDQYFKPISWVLLGLGAVFAIYLLVKYIRKKE